MKPVKRISKSALILIKSIAYAKIDLLLNNKGLNYTRNGYTVFYA